MLPEGANRTESKQYEEVYIPACEPAPTSIGSKRIPTSSLDKVKCCIELRQFTVYLVYLNWIGSGHYYYYYYIFLFKFLFCSALASNLIKLLLLSVSK